MSETDATGTFDPPLGYYGASLHLHWALLSEDTLGGTPTGAPFYEAAFVESVAIPRAARFGPGGGAGLAQTRALPVGPVSIVSFWVRPPADPGDGTTSVLLDATNPDFSDGMRVSVGRQLYLQVPHSENPKAPSIRTTDGLAIQPETWTHVIIARAPAPQYGPGMMDARIYVDGVMADYLPYTGKPTPLPAFVLGHARYSDKLAFRGAIAGLRVLTMTDPGAEFEIGQVFQHLTADLPGGVSAQPAPLGPFVARHLGRGTHWPSSYFQEGERFNPAAADPPIADPVMGLVGKLSQLVMRSGSSGDEREAHTVCAWLWRARSTSTVALGARGGWSDPEDPDRQGWTLTFDGAGARLVITGGSTWTCGVRLPEEVWTHVAVTVLGDGFALWIQGARAHDFGRLGRGFEPQMPTTAQFWFEAGEHDRGLGARLYRYALTADALREAALADLPVGADVDAIMRYPLQLHLPLASLAAGSPTLQGLGWSDLVPDSHFGAVLVVPEGEAPTLSFADIRPVLPTAAHGRPAAFTIEVWAFEEGPRAATDTDTSWLAPLWNDPAPIARTWQRRTLTYDVRDGGAGWGGTAESPADLVLRAPAGTGAVRLAHLRVHGRALGADEPAADPRPPDDPTLVTGTASTTSTPEEPVDVEDASGLLLHAPLAAVRDITGRHYTYAFAMDISGRERHGRVSQSPTAVPDDVFGTALELSGIDAIDFGEVPPRRGGGYTIEGWFQITSTGDKDEAVLLQRRGWPGFPLLRVWRQPSDSGAPPRWQFVPPTDTPADATDGPEAMPPGEWWHVALVHDGGELALWLNGVRQPVGPSALDVDLAAPGWFTLGLAVDPELAGWGDFEFRFRAAHLRVYDRALTPDEIDDTRELDALRARSLSLFPLEFRLFDAATDQPTLFLGDERQIFTLELHNVGRDHLTVPNLSTEDQPDAPYLSLAFRPGTLAQPERVGVVADGAGVSGWRCTYQRAVDGTDVFQLTRTTSPLTVLSGQRTSLRLSGLVADPRREVRESTVRLSYLLHLKGHAPLNGTRHHRISLTRLTAAAMHDNLEALQRQATSMATTSTDLEGRTEQQSVRISELAARIAAVASVEASLIDSIEDMLARLPTPLDVGLVGRDRVLVGGRSTNALTLAIGTRSALAVTHVDDDSHVELRARFTVRWEPWVADTAPWGLAATSDLESMTATSTNAAVLGWEQRPTSRGEHALVLEAAGATTLQPHAPLLVRLEGFPCNADPGIAHLTVEYEHLGGADNNGSVTVEVGRSTLRAEAVGRTIVDGQLDLFDAPGIGFNHSPFVAGEAQANAVEARIALDADNGLTLGAQTLRLRPGGLPTGTTSAAATTAATITIAADAVGNATLDVPGQVHAGSVASSVTDAGVLTASTVRASGPITAGEGVIAHGPAWGNLVPTGVIVMWSGPAAAIPDGWQLCDGRPPTPDLSGRFVVGMGGGYTESSRLGGSDTVVLSIDQMPLHRHEGTSGSAGVHHHSIKFSADNLHHAGGASESNWQLTSRTLSADTEDAGAHVHDITTSSVGGRTAIDIRPRYYALCFIMKV